MDSIRFYNIFIPNDEIDTHLQTVKPSLQLHKKYLQVHIDFDDDTLGIIKSDGVVDRQFPTNGNPKHVLVSTNFIIKLKITVYL